MKNKSELKKYGLTFASGLVLGFLMSLILGNFGTKRGFSDGFTVAALLLLIVGLCKTVGRLGLFERTAFGFKKFVEVIKNKTYSHSTSAIPTFEDYKKSKSEGSSGLNFIAAGALDLIIAFILL